MDQQIAHRNFDRTMNRLVGALLMGAITVLLILQIYPPQ
jgi:hypothetical protein